MLYLVATPIGNLADFSYRAIEVLQSCDYILCEDTRHSSHLLQKYQIKKPLKSYHKFSEAKSQEVILKDLKEGKTLALISDAGTPGIADPGHRLVLNCIAHQIPLTSIPGPCALIQALITSGLSTDLFQFCGFLPKKSGQLETLIKNILEYEGTTVCYESPMRIQKVINLFATIAPERNLVIARELTKKFEEFIRGTSIELAELLKQRSLKGELVLLIEGKPLEKKIKKYPKPTLD